MIFKHCEAPGDGFFEGTGNQADDLAPEPEPGEEPAFASCQEPIVLFKILCRGLLYRGPEQGSQELGPDGNGRDT